MKISVPFNRLISTSDDFGSDGAAFARVNMYPHSGGGLRSFPGSQFFCDSIGVGVELDSTTAFDSVGSGATSAFVIGDSGSKVYHYRGGTIYQYSLSTAWDISTRSYASKSYAIASVRDLWINTAGSILYALQGSVVQEIDLSTPFDLATASLGGSYNFSAQTSNGGRGLALGDSDSKMYIMDGVGDFYQYTITSGDVTTASYASKTFSSGQSARGLDLHPSGTKLITTESGDVSVYDFGASWDISTISHAELLDFQGIYLSSAASSIQWKSDGTNFYYGNSFLSSGYIHQASSGAAYSVTYATSDRGGMVMSSVPYAVMGNGLYRFSSGGVATHIGPIRGSGRCGLATDGANLVICAGSNKYNYTTAGGLVSITDADLDDCDSVAYLDSRFIFQQPSGQFVVSALNDPTSVDALDFGTTESFGDNLIAVEASNQLAYFFGEKTTEVWYTSGVGRPPLERQAVIGRGLAGKSAVSSIDGITYFLDENRRPCRLLGLEVQEISAPRLGAEFDGYSQVNDCVVNAYSWENDVFVEYNFLAAERTWVFHAPSQEWSSRRYGSSVGGYRVTTYLSAYNKLLGISGDWGFLGYGAGDAGAFEFSQSLYSDEYKTGDSTFTDSIYRYVCAESVTAEFFRVSGRELAIKEISATVESNAGGALTFGLVPNNNHSNFLSRSVTTSEGLSQVNLFSWGKVKRFYLVLSFDEDKEFSVYDLSADVEAFLS